MKFRLVALAGSLAVLLMAQAAYAEEPGVYVGAMGGVTSFADANNSFPDGMGGTVPVKSTSRLGFNGGVSGGYQFWNGFRVEGELADRHANFDTVTVFGISAPSNGNVNVTSVMANGFYDFDLGSRFKPYLGVGLGVAVWEISNLSSQSAAFALAGNGSSTVLAYQAIAGVGYDVARHTTLFLDVRYFATTDPSFKSTNGGNLSSEVSTLNASVGIRYRF